jgi:prepilin-type N-terminal cleavage/methylation domain-containing protein
MSIHNPRLRKLNQRGVTFIELLIVMGLLSILLVIMLTIFTSSIDDQAQSEGYAATISDGRFLLARLNYDIARATAVTNPATLGSTSSSLGLTINGATYTYALVDGNLQLTDGSGTANLNSSGTSVSAVSFQEIGNPDGKPTIVYNFTVTSTATHASGPDVESFTSAAGLR